MTATKPKRGDQIPPPPRRDEYDLRYATKEALAFPEVARQYPGTATELLARLRVAPDVRSDVQKPLKGRLGTRMIRGETLPQWQYDISSGHRLWYCVDKARRIVWFTYAGAHPLATTSQSGRAPRTR